MFKSSLLRFGVSACLLAWIGMKTDWVHVGAALRALRGQFWLASLGLLMVAQGISTLRWQLFARALRFQKSLVQMTGYYFIGMFFNLFLPTSVGGDVVRGIYLDGKSGRKLAAFASVFLDRLNGLLVLVAIACVAVVVAPIDLPTWVTYSVAAVAGAGVLGLAALPLVARSGFLPPNRVRQLKSMIELLREPKSLALATFLSVLVQAASVIIVWLIGVGMHLDVPGAYYWILVPMISILTLLPSVNGMGVRETGMVLFLAPFGVSQAAALTLAFLWFLVYAAGSMVGGLIYLAGAFPKPQAAADGLSAEEFTTHGRIVGDPDQGREGQLSQAA